MGYLPHTPEDRRSMLAAIGVPDTDALFADIPEAVRFRGELDVAPAQTEAEILRHLGQLAARNQHVETRPCLLGAGAYRHFVPSCVDAVISRAEFSTAYTPYQPEASQGTLQAIFEFQSMIAALTGLDVANASLYDGASAAAEAMLLATSATGRRRVLVSRALHPHYREVLRTYAGSSGDPMVEEVPLASDGATDIGALRGMLGSDVAAVMVQDPSFLGVVEGSAELSRLVREAGAVMVAVNNDPTAWGLIKRPGDWGADVAVGEAAPAGLPLSLGGPYVGFIALREVFVKRLPGRLVGLTSDQEGRRGFCLTLQTREQHIRREKATSNICTNQSLCALAVTVYLTALGPQGLREVAAASARRARYLMAALEGAGLSRRFTRPFFHEVVMRSPVPVPALNRALAEAGMVGGYALGEDYPDLSDCVLLCATEVLSRADVDAAVAVVKAAVSQPVEV